MYKSVKFARQFDKKMEVNDSEKLVPVTGEYIFRMGEMFSSYEELEKRLELHCSESLVYYWRRDTRTVKGACTKTSRPIANKLKYYSLRYACVFGGEKKKSRGQGKRHNNKSLRKDCPSFIMLRASKDGRNLEVVGVNNEHNHDCSNDVNQNLPHTRKLPEDIKQEVVEMMLMHIDRKKIIEYVKKKTNKSITVKDLFNLKAKYKHFNFKLERSKDEILQFMGMSPSPEERYESDNITMEDESKEWLGVCYDENVIEYDEYGDYQEDVEIDVEVQSENFVEFTVQSCVQTEFSHSEVSHTDLQEFNLDKGQVYTSTNTPDCEFNSVIEVDHEVEYLDTEVEDLDTEVEELDKVEQVDHLTEEVTMTQRNLDSPTEQNLQKQQSPRNLRLKWFIQRENNRLKKKLTNCRVCGTNFRFLDMQISVLKAEKEKLLEETSMLRLTKEKLMGEVTSMQSNIFIE